MVQSMDCNPDSQIALDLRQGQQKTGRSRFLHWLAEWTGLEPATPGVTGRYSNQLNYHSISAHRRHQDGEERGES